MEKRARIRGKDSGQLLGDSAKAQGEDPRVTICISAICNVGINSKSSVVVITDRMITDESLALEFEQKLNKIRDITNYCTITNAGDALPPADILRDTEPEVRQLTSPTILQIAETIKEKFIGYRKKNVEEEVLRPRGFSSLEDFYSKMRDLPSDIYTVIDDQITRFHEIQDSYLELLVSGVDHLGGHIYLVYDPGRVACFDSIGYNAIGSGETHALSVLVSYDYTNRFPLNSALWITYEAKKRAEKAPGVGKDTDMCIIRADGITHLGDETLQQLDDIYQKRVKSDRGLLEKLPQFEITKNGA